MSTAFTGQPQNVAITAGGNDVGPGNPLPTAPVAPAAVASVTCYASATLAATYDADPSGGAAGVAIPATALGATILLGYTRVSGQAGGQASHKVFTYDGTRWAQMPNPDNSYDPGLPGRASTGNAIEYYELAIPRLPPGHTRIAIINAETGNPAQLGTIVGYVTFQ